MYSRTQVRAHTHTHTYTHTHTHSLSLSLPHTHTHTHSHTLTHTHTQDAILTHSHPQLSYSTKMVRVSRDLARAVEKEGRLILDKGVRAHVATISRLLKIIGLFCRMQSLL